MASIPSNGYREVMAGTNVYTGSNFYGSDCPKTPIVPTDPDDLCNKLYVDTIVGGGSVVSVTGGNNILVAPTTVAPVVSLRSPLTATLALGTQNITGTTSNVILTDNTATIQMGGAGIVPTNYSFAGINRQDTGNLVIQNSVPTVLGGGGIELNCISGTVSTNGSFKPATILDTFASGAGTVGQVLSSLGGAGTKWITNAATFGTLDDTLALGNTATGTYANITLTDTDVGGQANPILTLVNTQASNASVAMEVWKNKPTAGIAGDVLFNQSVYGTDSGLAKQEYTRISHTIRDATGSSEDGSIEFSCFQAGVMANFIQINGVENEVNFNKPIDMVGNNIRTSTGSMTITTALSTGLGNITQTAKGGVQITGSNGLVNLTSTTSSINLNATGAGGSITLTSNSASGVTQITGGGATFGVGNTIGIQTGQPVGVRTQLRTGVVSATGQNLDFYPSYVTENAGSTTSLSLPFIPFQNLTIINSGISPTYSWSDVGDVVGDPTAFLRASSGQVWVGISGSICVYSDFTFTNPPVFQFFFNGGGDAYVFYESNGFMYVGGTFAGLTTSPQAQAGLMRFSGSSTLTPLFDPIFDGVTGDFGVAGYVNAIACDNTNLYVGGLFTSTFGSGPPTPLSNLCIISNPFALGSSQVYSNDVVFGVAQFATNGEVYAMEWVQVSGQNYIYVGGNFTNVASGLQSINYGAIYGVGWSLTPFTTIGSSNSFNGPITSFGKAIDGVNILFTGSFNFIDVSEQIKYGGYQDYSSYTNQLGGFMIASITPSSNLCRNAIAIFNSGTYNFFITDDRQVWFGTDINVWEDGGVAFSSGIPKGIAWYSATGYPYVAMPTSTFGFRYGVPLSSTAVFQLPSQGFKVQAGSFSKATLPEYAAQAFVADINGLYWHAVGTPIATFSN